MTNPNVVLARYECSITEGVIGVWPQGFAERYRSDISRQVIINAHQDTWPEFVFSLNSIAPGAKKALSQAAVSGLVPVIMSRICEPFRQR